MDLLKINCIVRCKQSDDLTKPFIGKIASITDTDAVVDVLDNNPSERHIAYNIRYSTRVNLSDVSLITIKKHTS